MTNEELQGHITALRHAYWSDQIQERAIDNEPWAWPEAGQRLLSDKFEYRIKPKPREVWIDLKTPGTPAVYFQDWVNGATHFREVVE